MNRKGFTLIELLVTIALLAIISVISFISINSMVNKSKITNCENLVDNIISVSKEYVSDNRYKDSLDLDNDKIVNIKANILVDNNYLTSPIINPFDNNEMDANNINIEIKLNDDYSANSVTVYNSGMSQVKCEKGFW